MKKKLTLPKLGTVSDYRHFWMLSFWILYLILYVVVEHAVTTDYWVSYLPLDDKIPFCEYFIIPYLAWFGYVAFGVCYFFFKNKEEYYRLCTTLFTGMTIFLIVSTLYPNGHYLRPAYFNHDNICIQLVKWLYSTDTPTNLFPSIHVYNSICVNVAIWHSEDFKKHKAVRYGSAVLMVLIILSTMFLKQHSVFDVVTGTVLAVFLYSVVYNPNASLVPARRPVRKPRRI